MNTTNLSFVNVDSFSLEAETAPLPPPLLPSLRTPFVSIYETEDGANMSLPLREARMQLIASNLANAGTVTGDEKTAYRAIKPVFQSVTDSPGVSTVKVANVVTTNAEPTCHWLVWGLKGQRGKLLEGETPPRTGKNAVGNSEWLLPDPPEGETRQYLFQLFATDLPLVLMPGAGRAELLASLQGTITACAVLHATFTGGGEDNGAGWEDDDF